jgi:molybdopterin molybdotransferase
VFHKLPQRPGKPMLGAVVGDSKIICGLPGNPMSVLVTASRIALPVLHHLAGRCGIRPSHAIRLTNADAKAIDLWWHRPVRMTDTGCAELVQSMGSGDVIAIAGSDGFVELPPGASGSGPWPYLSWTGGDGF